MLCNAKKRKYLMSFLVGTNTNKLKLVKEFFQEFGVLVEFNL